jgi:hypothetical protein
MPYQYKPSLKNEGVLSGLANSFEAPVYITTTSKEGLVGSQIRF